MIKFRVYIDFDQVGDGGGTALLGQSQSNNPGIGGTLTFGAVGSAQTLRLQVAEGPVPGGDSPSNANFTTAFSTLATDISTVLNTAGAYAGGTLTPLQLIQAWSTGGL